MFAFVLSVPSARFARKVPAEADRLRREIVKPMLGPCVAPFFVVVSSRFVRARKSHVSPICTAYGTSVYASVNCARYGPGYVSRASIRLVCLCFLSFFPFLSVGCFFCFCVFVFLPFLPVLSVGCCHGSGSVGSEFVPQAFGLIVLLGV